MTNTPNTPPKQNNLPPIPGKHYNQSAPYPIYPQMDPGFFAPQKSHAVRNIGIVAGALLGLASCAGGLGYVVMKAFEPKGDPEMKPYVQTVSESAKEVLTLTYTDGAENKIAMIKATPEGLSVDYNMEKGMLAQVVLHAILSKNLSGGEKGPTYVKGGAPVQISDKPFLGTYIMKSILDRGNDGIDSNDAVQIKRFDSNGIAMMQNCLVGQLNPTELIELKKEYKMIIDTAYLKEAMPKK